MKVFPNDGFSLGPIGTLISHLHTCASLSFVCMCMYVCVRARTGMLTLKPIIHCVFDVEALRCFKTALRSSIMGSSPPEKENTLSCLAGRRSVTLEI